MPHQHSTKQLIIETVMFVGMFALAGHLTVNFWEKYVIQTELIHMKTSLNSMKTTITSIGNAYDNLYKELKGLKQTANNKQQLREPIHRHKNTHTVNHKSPNDVQVHTMIAETNIDNRNNKYVELRNATTITRYPKKSTKVGSSLMSPAEKRNCPYIIYDNKPRNHYKKCDEYQPYLNYWKF